MIDPTVLSISFSPPVAPVVKRITFHGLRHGHITYLLRAGVPVHIVSARTGHSRPSITHDTYSHLMTGADAAAAMQADETLRRTLTDRCQQPEQIARGFQGLFLLSGTNPVPIRDFRP